MAVASGCGCSQWEWVESIGVVSRRWMWMESMGVASGVVVRRDRDFLILLIPIPLVSVHFCSSIPTFCYFFNSFSFLFWYFL